MVCGCRVHVLRFAAVDSEAESLVVILWFSACCFRVGPAVSSLYVGCVFRFLSFLFQDVIDGLLENRVLVVCGDTGSGKSTQVPQMILSHPVLGRNARVVVTQVMCECFDCPQ